MYVMPCIVPGRFGGVNENGKRQYSVPVACRISRAVEGAFVLLTYCCVCHTKLVDQNFINKDVFYPERCAPREPEPDETSRNS